ncbi:MAG: DUF305 domain-containing protein [Gemmatimonadaceae bacterium]
MRPTNMRGTAATLLAAVSLAACASAGRETTTVPAATAPSASTSAASEQGRLAAIARARADSARRPYTEADIRFMSAMIGHHAQAIEMSRMAPTHGAGPSVLTLAERIINAQQDEIVTMQQWLDDRLQPVPEATPYGVMMMHDGVEHEMLMPGMLTDAQMKQLDDARGKEFDRLFLTFMIQHHRGAVSMVTELFGSYGAGQDELVFKFASDVNVDQTTEIARRERMLFDLALEGYSP